MVLPSTAADIDGAPAGASSAAVEPHAMNAADDAHHSQAGSVAPGASLPGTEEGAAEDEAGGNAWSGPDSWLEESCRRELAAAEALLPTVALPQQDAAAAPSEPQLVEPSPRGPPAAAATWRYLSDLRPAKLGMRAALPGNRTGARRVTNHPVGIPVLQDKSLFVLLCCIHMAITQGCLISFICKMPDLQGCLLHSCSSSCRSAAGPADVREQRRAGSAPPEAGTAAGASGTPSARAAVVAKQKAPRSAEHERIRGRCVCLPQLLHEAHTRTVAHRMSCATEHKAHAGSVVTVLRDQVSS